MRASLAANASSNSLEKVACGAFSDISSAAAGKKRGYCRLCDKDDRKPDRLSATDDGAAFNSMSGGHERTGP